MNRRKLLKSTLASLTGLALTPLITSPVRAADSTPTDDGIARPPIDFGSLDARQRTALHRSATALTAGTSQAALNLARQLRYIDGLSETPASMSAPLALRVLLDAALMDEKQLADRLGNPSPSVLKALWLMDPEDRDRRKTLEKIFPAATHQLIVIDTPANQIDFTYHPLVPGDFVVSRSAASGVYHTYLVTEVDDTGCAWALTPLPSRRDSAGSLLYTVAQVMLYDPANAGQGHIYDWSDPARSPLLQTGQRGLYIYRFKPQTFCFSATCSPLETALNQYLTQSGGNWHVLIRQPGKPNNFVWGDPLEPIHPASMIKVPIAMLFFSWLAESGEDLPTFLDSGAPGTDLSYRQLLQQMLVPSNETATDTLTRFLFEKLGADGIQNTLTAWNAPRTSIEPRRSTMSDLVTLLEGLWNHSLLPDTASNLILAWMNERTSGDHGRIWTLSEVVSETTPPAQVTIWNKRGSLGEATANGKGLVIIADMGIAQITTDDIVQPWLIFLHAIPEKGIAPFPYQQTYETLEALASGLIRQFAKFSFSS